MPDYNEGTDNFAFVEPERDPALDVGRGQKQVRQRRSFQHKRPPPRLFGDVFERVRADYVEKPDDSKAPAATDRFAPVRPAIRRAARPHPRPDATMCGGEVSF